jgi:uncharacterized protein (DUF2461 family)
MSQQATGTVTQAIRKFIWSFHDSLQRKQNILVACGSFMDYLKQFKKETMSIYPYETIKETPNGFS